MRVLLSVGCNSYSHIGQLHGAEKDASTIFSALVGTQEHQYDINHSKLAFSPSAENFRKLISETLYGLPNISVFTLFFAGHATVFDETLYLALSDTLSDRIPATAVGFPEILRSATGARPKQLNFVLDACNTGGLGFDIGSILKRTIIGNSDTMGISFVAAATAEQSALETSSGGAFTNEFAKILEGETFVQKAKPFLDLAEIAHQIQTGSKLNQTISYWTLNLQGPNLFSKNPQYSGPAYVTDKIVSQLNQLPKTSLLGENFKSAVAKITGGVNEREFSKTLKNIFLEIDPKQRIPLIYGLAEGLRRELAKANDQFLEARVLAVLLGIFNLCPNHERGPAIREVISWTVSANRRALLALKSEIAADRNVLLVQLFSDFYELPIRISDILGQCALLLFGQEHACSEDVDLVKTVIDGILSRYGNSVLALTDDQAAGYLLFLEMCRRFKLKEPAEEVLGRLYYDLHQNFARCAAFSLNAEERFSVLAERYQEVSYVRADLYNSPSDLATVILSFASLFELDEAVDFSLIHIDHTNINFFIPDTFDQLGLPESIDGTNYTIALGHQFWRCIDLRRILFGDIFPKFSSGSLLSWEDNFCSLATSLALRDRLAWHFVAQT